MRVPAIVPGTTAATAKGATAMHEGSTIRPKRTKKAPTHVPPTSFCSSPVHLFMNTVCFDKAVNAVTAEHDNKSQRDDRGIGR